MPPIKHALLGASSAARWIACTPSAQATANLPDEETKYAAEGTRAHELCEKALRYKLAKWEAGIPFDLLSDWAQQSMPTEMFNAVCRYTSFIHELWAGFPCRPGVFIEQEVDVSRWVPQGFGTCDCLLIGGGLLHIIDFKYGQGVPVNPEHNPQLMYYALGAYELFRETDEIEVVRMSIVQPRMQEEPQTWELPLADLLTWAREVLQPAAELAWRGEGVYHPGGHCRFCKAYPSCRAWQKQYGPLAGFEPYPEPATLSDEELGEWLQ